MLASIWRLGNQESFRGVANRFGINKGTLHHILMEICHSVMGLRKDVFHWPQQQMEQNAQAFTQRCGFPGIVGAIDGTHIRIPGPSAFRESYINRKDFPSLQLQVVANHKLIFMDIDCGYPGSVHDARVFRNSRLKTRLDGGALPDKFHLLGDSAYPFKPYLLVPYRDNGHLDAMQKTYNYKHSSTRVDVERAIGLLKGKWGRLRMLDMTSIKDVPYVILFACMLHNFVIQQQGVDDGDVDKAEEGGEEAQQQMQGDAAPAGEDRRHEIAVMLA